MSDALTRISVLPEEKLTVRFNLRNNLSNSVFVNNVFFLIKALFQQSPSPKSGHPLLQNSFGVISLYLKPSNIINFLR